MGLDLGDHGREVDPQESLDGGEGLSRGTEQVLVADPQVGVPAPGAKDQGREVEDEPAGHDGRGDPLPVGTGLDASGGAELGPQEVPAVPHEMEEADLPSSEVRSSVEDPPQRIVAGLHDHGSAGVVGQDADELRHVRRVARELGILPEQAGQREREAGPAFEPDLPLAQLGEQEGVCVGIGSDRGPERAEGHWGAARTPSGGVAGVEDREGEAIKFPTIEHSRAGREQGAQGGATRTVGPCDIDHIDRASRFGRRRGGWAHRRTARGGGGAHGDSCPERVVVPGGVEVASERSGEHALEPAARFKSLTSPPGERRLR